MSGSEHHSKPNLVDNNDQDVKNVSAQAQSVELLQRDLADAQLILQPVSSAQQLANHAQQSISPASVLTGFQQADVPEHAGAKPGKAQHKISSKPKMNGKPTVTEMNTLATLFNSGDLTESEQFAATITQRYPRHGFGWKVLGAIRQQQSLIDEAFQALKKAAELLPGDSEAHYNLGNCFFDQNKLEEAVASYQKAVKIDSGFAKAHFNLGSVFQKQGYLEQAEASYRKALKFDSNNAVIHFTLAQILSEQGRFSEAVDCYQQGLKIQPDLAAAHVNLGVAFKAMGQVQEAEACYRKALSINPDHVEAYNNLSVLFLEQGRIAEAETCCKKALEINPNYVDAYNNLGLILHGMGRFSEAESAFEKALEYDPGRVLVYSNFSVSLKAQGQITRAESYLRKAIEINPGYINSYTNLITVLLDQGRIREAITISLHALQIQPGCLKTRSNLLFSMNYSGSHSAEECLDQARQYGHIVAEKAGAVFTSWLHDPQAKRLRVGLVSGDFCQHAVAYFLENLVQHIDPSKIELIAYPTENRADAVTTRLKPHFSAWRSLVGLNDQAATQLIHNDGLHVLLDLSGHTSGNRLPVFAWKPAPVQVSWLGYFATTGVEAMDYFLADEVGVPELNQPQFTEKIKYLPDTRLCFTAPDVAIDASPLPALANGYITFGSFQNMAKVGDEVLNLWAEVMNALPNARLRWQCQSFGDAVVTESVVQRLKQRGFNLDRVTLVGSVSREDYLAAHAEVDLILDTFPFPGGTTTCEALWMGVPTLTLAGNTLIARQGASLLSAAGLGDWIAESKADYVRKALLFTGDLCELANLRVRLRAQVLASPLFDAPRFARNMETALWKMWNDSQSGSTKQQSPQIEKQMFPDNHDDGTADQSLKLNVEIVSATRYSENDFWSKSALGLSLKRHLKQDARLSANIAFENSRGLSEVFNDRIDRADENAILVFIHDDVWIDEANFADAVIAGLESFDVIGVAGNRRRVPDQPAWAFIDNQFTWDDKSNLSGHIAHGKSAFGKMEEFGPVPAECELMDGVFLAARKSSLKQNNVRFDAQFDFHFYDMDFCRSARQAGLRLGTWLVNLTHQSAGAFGSQHWREKYQRYLNKWEASSVNNDITFLKYKDTERERNLQQAMNEVFQIAIEHQNAGQIEQAESLYLEILNIQPKHAEANHNLGVIEAHSKGALAGLPRLELAVQENPENEQFWVSYIDALMQSGATDTAVNALELGQKFGLRSETAQMLAAEFVTELESKVASPQAPTSIHHLGVIDLGAVEAHSKGALAEVSRVKMDIPVLSLCIPTYNRGNLLKKALESITCQEVFINTSEVEIVIADNCSTDETQSISEAFATAYPGKIKYIRNSTNIGAGLNFEVVLSHGTGLFLKLLNDNLLVRDGSLTEILKVIKASSIEKPVIFLTNGNKPSKGLIGVAANLSEFVRDVSFFSTWIGAFGIWRDEFQKTSDFSRNTHLLLPQTDILFSMIAAGKRALILYDTYFVGMDVGKKGGYNIAEVFGKNYLSLLKHYCALGILNTQIYEIEKKEILLKHIIPYYFDKNNDFHKTGFFEHMQDYVHDDYFYKAIEGLISTVPATVEPQQATPEQKIANYWRQLNSHNETELQLRGIVKLNKIQVGRRTYGKLFLWGFGNDEESLTIGSFVSIAEDVKFILGGNHPYLGFSTFPFLAKYFGTLEATTKGAIVVGDDVWIGYNSTILSGVTIGQGSVIAAGSMVTRDVAPYSIVGGNPARLIKYRFDKEIIDKLSAFDFSQLSDENILQNKDNLYAALTPENVDAILSQLR